MDKLRSNRKCPPGTHHSRHRILQYPTMSGSSCWARSGQGSHKLSFLARFRGASSPPELSSLSSLLPVLSFPFLVGMLQP